MFCLLYIYSNFIYIIRTLVIIFYILDFNIGFQWHSAYPRCDPVFFKKVNGLVIKNWDVPGSHRAAQFVYFLHSFILEPKLEESEFKFPEKSRPAHAPLAVHIRGETQACRRQTR
jgi:hypothetical protein